MRRRNDRDRTGCAYRRAKRTCLDRLTREVLHAEPAPRHRPFHSYPLPNSLDRRRSQAVSAAMSALRFLLLAALVGATLGSAGHGVHHLTESDFAEKTADGKASLRSLHRVIGPLSEAGRFCWSLPVLNPHLRGVLELSGAAIKRKTGPQPGAAAGEQPHQASAASAYAAVPSCIQFLVARAAAAPRCP